MEIGGMSLDATSSPEMAALAKEGKRSNADISQNYMQDTGKARGLLDAPDTSNQKMAYSNPMSTAIKNRYSNDFNFQSKQLNNRILRAASEDNIRNLAATTQAATQEVLQNRQKEMLRNEIDQANKRARGQVLGTVLGITGGIGAMAATGGNPAAGMAGYQMGSGAGQMYGSNN